jgi:hypothetical protein
MSEAEMRFMELLSILGAGGGGAYMAVKVALAQVLASIKRAQDTANASHARLDDHMTDHAKGLLK